MDMECQEIYWMCHTVQQGNKGAYLVARNVESSVHRPPTRKCNARRMVEEDSPVFALSAL